MPDPNLPLLEDAVRKLAPFLDEIVFVGGVTLGLLITDKAAAPIRGTNDVDVIAEIVTYADYIAFSERLRKVHFTEDEGEHPLTCRWHNGGLTLDVLALSEEVLGLPATGTATCWGNCLRHPRSGRLRAINTAVLFRKDRDIESSVRSDRPLGPSMRQIKLGMGDHPPGMKQLVQFVRTLRRLLFNIGSGLLVAKAQPLVG